MSEVKGALLAIVLAIAVFGAVLSIVSIAMKQSAQTVADRMDGAASEEPDLTGSVSVAYTFHGN